MKPSSRLGFEMFQQIPNMYNYTCGRSQPTHQSTYILPKGRRKTVQVHCVNVFMSKTHKYCTHKNGNIIWQRDAKPQWPLSSDAFLLNGDHQPWHLCKLVTSCEVKWLIHALNYLKTDSAFVSVLHELSFWNRTSPKKRWPKSK